MSARATFSFVEQLILDTFRQALASGICAMMLAITAICVLFCASISVTGGVSLEDQGETVYFLPHPPSQLPGSAAVASLKGRSPVETSPELARSEGVETLSGRMSLAFGAVTFPLSRERADSVHFLEMVLAGAVAGTFGLLLALVWTAGFVPTFLDAGSASVLLTKPVARWQLLLGKYVGVLIFVAFQLVLFVALTWLALGLRTGIWHMTYWLCIPLLLLQFAIFYSFSVLLAVITRSTVACVFGSILFWLLSWGINYGSVMARGMTESRYLPPFTHVLTESAYWVSPKPIDAGLILFNTLDAHQHFEKPEIFSLIEAGRVFSPQWSILSCIVITGMFLALAIHEFNAADY